MARFFVSPEEMTGDTLVLTGENAQHAKVLRLKVDEEVTVCDGQGTECTCTVTETEDKTYNLAVVNRMESQSEANVKISVYMAYPKGDKLEHVIQKATELGAYEIVAFPSGRCVSKPDEKSLKKKQERWQKIAASAAEQSGRGRIPEIVVLNRYHDAIERGAQTDLPILFYENESATTLHMALEQGDFHTVCLMSGPEGGWDEKEVQQAKSSGFRICTLGKRILRCETAPLCALSAVMYHIGQF